MRELAGWGVRVVVSNPWADAADVHRKHGFTPGPVDAGHKVDAMAMAVAQEQYRGLTPARLKSLCRGAHPVLADLKALCNRHDASQE